MSATDRLRAMLDERGVEWWSEDDPEEPSYYFITKWFANGCEQTYEEIPAIRSRSLKAYCITPEQAIAATLGSRTLTAEHVQELMESHSREYQSPTDPYVYLRMYDWQAIADELNATLGSGTCQNEGDPSDFLCSECGARMFTDTGETYTMIDSLGNIIEQPNFCPNCGRRVEVDA